MPRQGGKARTGGLGPRLDDATRAGVRLTRRSASAGERHWNIDRASRQCSARPPPAASSAGESLRRQALVIGVRALGAAAGGLERRASCAAGAAPPRRSRATACRPSAISNIRPTSSISTTSIRTRRRAARFRSSARRAPVQSELPHLQFAQRATSCSGDGAQGMELTFASLTSTGRAPTTSRMRCTGSPRARCASRPTG